MIDMQTFHKRAMVFNTPSAIFRVPTRERGDVFMRIGRTGYGNDSRAVVEVVADRFLDLWRRYGSHGDIARGNPTTWVRDRKFSSAEEGFAGGEGNPVPLADVGCAMCIEARPLYRSRYLVLREVSGYERSGIPHMGFTDGITRTIWLLTYGASVFPVMCSVAEAPLLQQLAGLPGGSFRTVDQLVPAAAVSLRTYAAAVMERTNVELFEELLDAFEGAADELGYRFVPGTGSPDFPAHVRRALGEAVVAAQCRYLNPQRPEIRMIRSLISAREDGYGDMWVTSIMQALASQGIVAERRPDHLPGFLERCFAQPGDTDA